MASLVFIDTPDTNLLILANFSMDYFVYETFCINYRVCFTIWMADQKDKGINNASKFHDCAEAHLIG